MHRQSKHLKIDLVIAFEDRNAEKENQGPLQIFGRTFLIEIYTIFENVVGWMEYTNKGESGSG